MICYDVSNIVQCRIYFLCVKERACMFWLSITTFLFAAPTLILHFCYVWRCLGDLCNLNWQRGLVRFAILFRHHLLLEHQLHRFGVGGPLWRCRRLSFLTRMQLQTQTCVIIRSRLSWLEYQGFPYLKLINHMRHVNCRMYTLWHVLELLCVHNLILDVYTGVLQDYLDYTFFRVLAVI